MKTEQKLAAILVRGREVGVRSDVKQALDMLRLRRKNVCVVLADTPVNRGLMDKAKDLVAYGPITAETFAALQKRGSRKSEGEDLNVFSLSPPLGGFERKGVKTSYQEGGALGLRRKTMDELIKKMLH